MDEQAKKKFLITTAYIVTVGAIVFIVCRFLLKYLMPFIIGGLVAWAVQKPAYYISGKTRLNPKISAAALTIAVFAVLAGHTHFHYEFTAGGHTKVFIASQGILGNINRYDINGGSEAKGGNE